MKQKKKETNGVKTIFWLTVNGKNAWNAGGIATLNGNLDSLVKKIGQPSSHVARRPTALRYLGRRGWRSNPMVPMFQTQTAHVHNNQWSYYLFLFLQQPSQRRMPCYENVWHFASQTKGLSSKALRSYHLVSSNRRAPWHYLVLKTTVTSVEAR